MKKICCILLFCAPILRGAIWAQKTKATVKIDTSTVLNPLQKEGWTLLWHDEFDEDKDSLDPHVWWPQASETPKTLTIFTARPENVRAKDGALHLVNQKEDYKGYPFTGGLVFSARTVAVNSRVEAAMKIPKGKSLWPCFWLLGGLDSLYQEVDIAEFGCSRPAQFDISNHFYDKQQQKVTAEWRRIQTKRGRRKLDLSEAYHLYAVEWTTDALLFYLDNQLVYELQIGRAHV